MPSPQASLLQQQTKTGATEDISPTLVVLILSAVLSVLLLPIATVLLLRYVRRNRRHTPLRRQVVQPEQNGHVEPTSDLLSPSPVGCILYVQR